MGKGASLVILFIIPFIFVNSASAILFLWNGTNSTIPENFTCVSCQYTDAFYEEYPRINTTNINQSFYDFEDFPYLHTHSILINTTSADSTVTATAGVANGFNVASNSHRHTSATVTPSLSNIAIVPYTKGLLIISARENITYLPVGVIAFFNDTVAPENFSLFTDNDGSLIMGNNTKTTFGNFTHSHTMLNFTTSNPNGGGNSQAGFKQPIATLTHTHKFNNQNFSLDSHIPAFVNMPLIIVVNYTYIPKGVIAMFDASSFSSGWNNISAGLQNRFIWANSTSFNITGGNFTHNHSEVYGYMMGGSESTNRLFCTFGCGNYPLGSHSHYATIKLSSTQNLPPYRNIAIGIFDGIPLPPNVTVYNWSVVNDFALRYGERVRQEDDSYLYVYAGMILFGLPLLAYMVMRFVPKKKAL